MVCNIGQLNETKKIMVLSDLHIGDPRSNSLTLELLCSTIKDENPNILILAGDIFEENLSTLTQVDYFKNSCDFLDRVIVLKGNHDGTTTRHFASLVESSYDRICAGASGSKKFVVEHGDRFDGWIVRAPVLGKVAIWVNRVIYNICSFDLQAWLRSKPSVERRLKNQHKKAKRAHPSKDIVVTGHTHYPTDNSSGEGYFNSGDWIYHKTYIIIQNEEAKLEIVK